MTDQAPPPPERVGPLEAKNRARFHLAVDLGYAALLLSSLSKDSSIPIYERAVFRRLSRELLKLQAALRTDLLW